MGLRGLSTGFRIKDLGHEVYDLGRMKGLEFTVQDLMSRR